MPADDVQQVCCLCSNNPSEPTVYGSYAALPGYPDMQVCTPCLDRIRTWAAGRPTAEIIGEFDSIALKVDKGRDMIAAARTKRRRASVSLGKALLRRTEGGVEEAIKDAADRE